MKLPIYLDYNATTPTDRRVLEAMLPYFSEHFGNASSKGHPYGWAADEAVEQARADVAALIGAQPREIVFTSGATEAANLAIKGAAEAYASKGRHIVTTQVEHRAVLESCKSLERRGFTVTYVPVNADGVVEIDALAAALTDQTTIVAVMWANNETGVMQPIPEINRVVRERGALLMTDATQAVGKVPVSVEHVDLLVCSAHKFYGPKGTGALWIRQSRPRVRLLRLLDGGGHEGGLRAGTQNVPGIVGMGAAARIALEELAGEQERLAALRDRFEADLARVLEGVQVQGKAAPRLPQTSSMTFKDVRAADLMLALRSLAVSAGSACSSGTPAPSHVLKAIGLSDDEAAATIRFSLGRFTTEEEIAFAVNEIARAVCEQRHAGPVAAG